MQSTTKARIRKILYNIIIVLVVYLLTTLLGYSFLTHEVKAPYLLLLYLLGTIIIVLETSSFITTVFSSFLFMFSHTFLFLEPRYSFQIHQRSFLLTTTIFLTVAIFVNILMVRLRREMDRDKKEAELHKHLYNAIEGLLKVQGKEEIVSFANDALTELAQVDTRFLLDIPKDEENEAVRWCFRNSSACGHGEVEYSDDDYKYLPLRFNRQTIGVVSLDCSVNEPDADTMDAIHALMSQLTLALQRSHLEEQAKKEAAVYAREKIKGQVMKDLSHDMSPRITSVKNLSEELRNAEGLSIEEVNERLDVIVKEANYLYDTVDNILDITNK